MITTLIKMNMLSSKRHIIYSRYRSNSVLIVKELFSEIHLPTECHSCEFNVSEMDDIKSVAKENVELNPLFTSFCNQGTVLTIHHNNYCNNINNGTITYGTISTNPNGMIWVTSSGSYSFNSSGSYQLNKSILNHSPSTWTIVPGNLIEEPNVIYEIVIYDDLIKFLHSITLDSDTYYYINNKSYSAQELNDFIDGLIKEKNNEI